MSGVAKNVSVNKHVRKISNTDAKTSKQDRKFRQIKPIKKDEQPEIKEKVHEDKQGYLLKLCMSTYDKKQMFGFVRSKIQIPYLYIDKNNRHIASKEEFEKYKDSEKEFNEDGTSKHPFIFYPNKKFVYLMYKNNPRLYVETRDVVDGKTSPIYYKQIGLSWMLTDKEFNKYSTSEDKLPILTVVCKECDKVASITPGTIFHVSSNGKLIRSEFDTKGKIIINDRRKKYPFEWNKQSEKVEAK